MKYTYIVKENGEIKEVESWTETLLEGLACLLIAAEIVLVAMLLN